MPKVNSSVKASFPAGTPFGLGLFPDEAVAIGATTQAFLLQVERYIMRGVVSVFSMFGVYAWTVPCCYDFVLFFLRSVRCSLLCDRGTAWLLPVLWPRDPAWLFHYCCRDNVNNSNDDTDNNHGPRCGSSICTIDSLELLCLGHAHNSPAGLDPIFGIFVYATCPLVCAVRQL